MAQSIQPRGLGHVTNPLLLPNWTVSDHSETEEAIILQHLPDSLPPPPRRLRLT